MLLPTLEVSLDTSLRHNPNVWLERARAFFYIFMHFMKCFRVKLFNSLNTPGISFGLPPIAHWPLNPTNKADLIWIKWPPLLPFYCIDTIIIFTCTAQTAKEITYPKNKFSFNVGFPVVAYAHHKKNADRKEFPKRLQFASGEESGDYKYPKEWLWF